jgi:hypothetical protein
MASLRIYRDRPLGDDRAPDDLVRIRTDGGARRGSAGNVIAALASFIVPGLGQLVQGRPLAAAVLFAAVTVGYALWILLFPAVLAFLLHAVSVIDAALWEEA